MLKRNTLAGGVNGTNVSVNGDLGGDPFDFLFKTPAGVGNFYGGIAYSSDHPRAGHALSARFTTAVQNAVAYLGWAVPQGTAEYWTRMYVFLPSTWAVGIRVLDAHNSADNRMSSSAIRVNPNNAVQMRGAFDAILGITALSLPTNAWSRVETHVLHDPTVGLYETKLFLTDPESDNVDEVRSVSGNTAVDPANIRMGIVLAGLDQNIYMGGLGISTVGWLGPEFPVVGEKYKAGLLEV